VDELAQLFIWALLIALAIVAIQQGPAGLKTWMRSKFLGRQPGEG